MEGKKFKHKYLPYLTCVVVAATRKGDKVLETQVLGGRRKPKRQPTTTTLILIKSVVCGRKKASNNR